MKPKMRKLDRAILVEILMTDNVTGFVNLVEIRSSEDYDGVYNDLVESRNNNVIKDFKLTVMKDVEVIDNPEFI